MVKMAFASTGITSLEKIDEIVLKLNIKLDSLIELNALFLSKLIN